MDLPKNARVDILGRSHEGKHIYRVIVDGYPATMYMVDAASDTVDRTGKSLFNNPPSLGLVGDLIPPSHKQMAADERMFATVVVPFDTAEEPPVRGSMLNGLNKAWVDWYRLQDKGHSLLEACEEGLRRLGGEQATDWAKAPEPGVIPRFAGSTLPSQEWITWYRRKTGVTIQEAVEEGQRRISLLPKQ